MLDGDGQYHRLGDEAVKVSNFRLIGATNRDLKALKHDVLARFRYRVQVPNLNERKSDIPFLIRELVARAGRRSPNLVARFVDRGHVRIQPHLVEALVRHQYREHTRELDRLLGVSMETSRGDYLLLTSAVDAELRRARSEQIAAAKDGEADHEAPGQEAVVNALAFAGGKVTLAANLLGVSRFTLYRLMKQYNLAREQGSTS